MVDQDRLDIHTEFGGQAFEWERMSHKQLTMLILDLEEQAGSTRARIASKYTYYLALICIYIVGFVTFWTIIYTLTSKAYQFFDGVPILQFVIPVATLFLSLSFPFWAMSDEKMAKIWSPMSKWSKLVKDQQEAYEKLQAVRFYQQKKKQDPNYPTRK